MALEVQTKGRRAELAFLRSEVDQTRTALQIASQKLDTARAQNRVHASLLAERQVRARFSGWGEAGKSLTYASCLSPAPGAFRARWPSRTRRTRSCWRRRLRWARVSASKRAALSLSVARRTVSHHRAETRPRFQRRLPEVAGGQRREDPVRPCRTASEAGYRPLC